MFILHLLIFLLSFASLIGVFGAEENEIPDVTTIFNLRSDRRIDNPVEIHLRNNAKGMPVFLEKVGFVEPENEQSVLLCWYPITWGEKNCNWTPNNFIWTSNGDSYWKDALKRYDREFKNSIAFTACQMKSTPYEQTNCDLRINFFNSFKSYQTITLTYPATYYCSGNCKITISSGLCRKPMLYTNCDFLTSISIDYQDSVFFFIEIVKNKLKVWKDLARGTLLFETNAEAYMVNKIKKISSSNSNEKIDVHQLQMLESNTSNSSLTSRLFPVTSPHFCLRVIYHLESSLRRELISATAVDSNDNHHHLGTLVHTGLSGWNSWKLEASLPDGFVGKSVYLVLRTLTSRMIRIQRIASCTGDEQVTVITKEMTDESRPVPVVLMKRDLQTFGRSPSCDNSGVLTSSGCACPAGFAGPNCTRGCGPNRYGQDCLGQCSIYNDQCAGLMLCTSGAGCNCAPGYRGEACELSCLPGTFGANCQESCGECKKRHYNFHSSSPICDKFTGLCQACIPGYYPPFCKSKYVHFKEAPFLSTVKYGAVTVSIRFSRENIIGSGEPAFYQVQYKREESAYSTEDWTALSAEQVPRDLDTQTQVEVEVDGLKDGVQYRVRVILLAHDLNSYQEEDVPKAQISTKCDVPNRYDYNVSVSHSENTIISLFAESGYVVTSFSWAPYKKENHTCPLVEYEVSWKEGWWWSSKNVSAQENVLQLTNIMSNQKLSFKVRAKTTGGYAPYSSTLHTRTPYKGIFKVADLTANNVQSNRADISWQPPAADKEQEFIYTVTYSCVYRASCKTPCQSEGTFTTKDTSVVISHLLPLSQYTVSVSADKGPNTTILIATIQSVPVETPKKSDLEPVRTNSSVTVFWEHAPVCSGFFKNYTYQLYKASDLTKVIEGGKTRSTNVTFGHLDAATDYTVLVSVVTSGGWDPDTYLAINISTTATAPEAVQNLTVYKRSRGSVGLRWMEPRLMFGALSSFSVTYWPLSSGADPRNTTVRVEPQRCAVWPDLYCYTLEGLNPSRSYAIIVRARNVVVPEEGAGALVQAVTRESSPGAPENLSVINVTSGSLGLQWEHPNLTNGVLRSFLVSVEESEQFDHEQCCEIYPIIETTVTEERKFYQLEVSGLHPASTYSISVAGKTIGFGPSLTLTASTRPPSMHVPTPELNVDWVSIPKLKWETQTLSESNNSLSYTSLIKSRILLVISNTSLVDADIQDVRLKSLLVEKISQPFYMTAEYEEGTPVSLTPAEDDQNKWGRLSRPQLQEDVQYQLATAQISEYNGVLNVDLVFTTPFHIRYQSSNVVEA